MPRLVRLAGPALLVLVAFVALLLALLFGGGASAPLVVDPGAVVRWGLPSAKLVVDLAASATIGTLALTCFALSSSRVEWGRALDLAAGAAALWTVASGVAGFFTFLDVTDVAVTPDPQFGQTLSVFLTGTGLGAAWLVSTLIAAAVTVLCFAVRHTTAVLGVLLLAGAGLIPIAEQGHAAGSTSHVAAVTDLALHILGAAVWLGGLSAIVLLRSTLEHGRAGAVLARYSTLALMCFVVVAVSGYASAAIRLGSWSELGSRYGVLVLVKAVVLVLLGLFGVVHRRVVIARVQTAGEARRAPFWWFVTAELAFLGIASGVAAALSRTATPVSQTVLAETGSVTPAELLTDAKLPAEFRPSVWLTGWNLDLLWLLVCAFAVFAYLAGVARLRRRGDAWPAHRSVAWVVGMLVLFYATNGAPDVYERYLVSTHILVVVLVAFVVPVLVVASAPVTLALVTVQKRADGSLGPREWAMIVVQSRIAALATNPYVAVVLAVVSVWCWLFTPLLRWSVTEQSGHTVMLVELLLAGWGLSQVIVGVDPMRWVAPGILRLVVVAVAAVFVIVVGVLLATGSGLLMANWYGAMGRTWGAAPLIDQQRAGAYVWVVGLAGSAGMLVGLVGAGRTGRAGRAARAQDVAGG